jgi:hypothetical protein
MKLKDASAIAALVIVVTLVAACGSTAAPPTSTPVQPTATSGPESAVSAEIDQLFEDYIAAFNAYDVDAVRAVITEGYMLYEGGSFHSEFTVSSPISQEYPATWVLAAVQTEYPALKFHWERVGEPIMSGDGPWLVAQVVRSTSKDPQYPNGVEGISILTIVDEDGMLKVARDVFVAFEIK